MPALLTHAVGGRIFFVAAAVFPTLSSNPAKSRAWWRRKKLINSSCRRSDGWSGSPRGTNPRLKICFPPLTPLTRFPAHFFCRLRCAALDVMCTELIYNLSPSPIVPFYSWFPFLFTFARCLLPSVSLLLTNICFVHQFNIKN